MINEKPLLLSMALILFRSYESILKKFFSSYQHSSVHLISVTYIPCYPRGKRRTSELRDFRTSTELRDFQPHFGTSDTLREVPKCQHCIPSPRYESFRRWKNITLSMLESSLPMSDAHFFRYFRQTTLLGIIKKVDFEFGSENVLYIRNSLRLLHTYATIWRRDILLISQQPTRRLLMKVHLLWVPLSYNFEVWIRMIRIDTLVDAHTFEGGRRWIIIAFFIVRRRPILLLVDDVAAFRA